MIENANIKLAEDIKNHEPEGEKFGDWLPFVLKIVLIKNGKLDTNCCIVLSKICYWFTLKNNNKKRFYGDELRLSINDLSKQTLLSKAQTRHALELLESKYKYIRRTNIGSITYINLNTEILRNAISLHEVNFAHENETMCEKEHVHVHKGQTKMTSSRKREYDSNIKLELLRSKIDDVETTILNKNNELEDYKLSFDEFYNVCVTVSNIYDNKIKHGLDKQSLLYTYVYDLNSLRSQPAYAKLFYMYNDFPELWRRYVRAGEFNDSFNKLLEAFREECSLVPDIYEHFVDMLDKPLNVLFKNLLDFDLDKAKSVCIKRVDRINKDKLKLADTLQVYVSELKELKLGE